VADIIEAFKTFEKKNIDNSYWELNISCPNLIHAKDITFYPPKNLNELLGEVDKLNLKKPVLVKMPIEKSNKEVLKMLEVIADHSPKGVIFGNLQKDGRHPSLERGEVKKFKAGFFSGKPTFERSNELISLTYKNFRDRFVIVGCGGIFSGEDAYEKILRGASLVQLITGLIYEGPELIAKINFELADLLERDGFDSISEAVGSKFQV
jgi:dihydroorotate dehydrogenase